MQKKMICQLVLAAIILLSDLMGAVAIGAPGKDPFAADEVLANPVRSKGGPSFSSTAEFLPVERAYQLIPELDGSTLQLKWQIADGYYLYRNRFDLMDPNGKIHLAEPVFSNRGISRFDEYYGKELEVFYNSIQISYPNLPASQGFILIAKSQGCADAGLCYPPRTQLLRVDTASGLVEVSEAVPGGSGSEQPAQPTNWSTTLAMVSFAILGGVILNLMPCVFPILSIKALSFTSAHHSKHGKHLHGLAYAAGTMAAFVAIAFLLMFLRSAGQLIGWGFQLQSPVFVSYLAYLFFALGLSFSGMVEFGGGLMGLGQNRAGQGGIRTSFLSGILATVVASPCTAPFMGSALGFAMTQPPSTGLLIFAGLGLGMALPFLLLSWLPKLADYMPRPGPWMETFKQLLAFPLYLTVVWLIWVLGHQVDNNYVALLGAGMVVLAFGLWLWQRRAQYLFARMLAIVAISTALFVPGMKSEIDRKSVPAWQAYSETRLEDLRREGKPVFVNLTADWCITCLVNEKVALSSDEVLATFNRLNIVYLKGDWTNSDPQITRLLSRYRRNGVPLYLLFPPGKGDAVILPQLLTPSLILESIDQVWPK